jgi:hypothetical protein
MVQRETWNDPSIIGLWLKVHRYIRHQRFLPTLSSILYKRQLEVKLSQRYLFSEKLMDRRICGTWEAWTMRTIITKMTG